MTAVRYKLLVAAARSGCLPSDPASVAEPAPCAVRLPVQRYARGQQPEHPADASATPLRASTRPAGPAVYVLRIYEPHFERPRIIASPEGGRLVVRTWDGKRSLVAGDALCEAAYDGSLSPSGGSSSSSGPRSGASSGASGSGSGAESPRSPLDLPQELAAAWEAAKAAINTPVNAAVAPRAEVPLMACLMAIYQVGGVGACGGVMCWAVRARFWAVLGRLCQVLAPGAGLTAGPQKKTPVCRSTLSMRMRSWR